MADSETPSVMSDEAGNTTLQAGGWTIGSAYTVALFTAVYAFNYFDRLLISILLPLIKEDLQLTDTELGLVTGVAFVLVYAVMGIPIARLADKHSRKMIVGIGFTFWSAMTVATGYVQNLWQLAATRFLMGAGEAAGTPPSTSFISDAFNKKARPLAFSIMVSGTALSSLFLVPAAGWIGEHYGWRVAYFIAGGTGMFFGLLMLLTVKEPPRGQFEEKSATPSVERPPFMQSLRFVSRRKTFIFATAGAALVTVSYYAHIVWSNAFMVRVHGLSVGETASLLGPIRGVTGLIGAISGGFILNRLRPRDERWCVWLPAIAASLVGIAQFPFLFGPTIAVSAFGAALDSFAAALMVPLMSVLLIQVMPPSVRSFGMALYVLAIALIGQIVGPLGVGALNDGLAAQYGDLAIRYSMIFTAMAGIIGGPVMLIASRYLQADSEAAKTWDGN